MPSAAPDTIDLIQAFATLAPDAAPDSAVVSAGENIRLLAFPGIGGWQRRDASEETMIVLLDLTGTGGWHRHDADETLICWSGAFEVEYRDRTVRLQAGQCTVIARGQEHRGVSADGAQVVLVRAAA